MKPPSLALRSFALLSAASLVLPAPAQALRTSQPESPTQRAGLEESLKGSSLLIAPTGRHAAVYQSLFKAGVAPLELVPGWSKYLIGLPEGTRARFRVDPQTRQRLQGFRELGFEPLGDEGGVLERVRAGVARSRRPAQPQIQMGADGVEFLEFTFSPALELALLGADPKPSVGSIRVVPAGEFATFEGAGVSLDLEDPPLVWKQVRRAYEKDKKVEVLGIPWGVPDSEARKKLMEFLADLGEVEASALQGKLATEEEAWAEAHRPPEDKSRAELAQRRREELQAQALGLQGEAGRVREDLEKELEAVVDAHAGYLNEQRVQQLQQGIASLLSLLPAGRALSEDILRQARTRIAEEPKGLRQQIQALPGELPEPGQMPEVIARLLKEFPELEAPLTAKSAGMPAEDRRLAWYRALFERREVRQAGWSPARLAQFMKVFRRVEKEVNARLPGLPWFPLVLVGADREQNVVAGWILSGRTRRAGFLLNLLGERSNGEQTALHARFEILAAAANLLVYSDLLLQEQAPELPEEQARQFLMEEFSLLSIGSGRGAAQEKAQGGGGEVEENKARAESWMARFRRFLAGWVEEGLEGNPWLSGPKLRLSGSPQDAPGPLQFLRSAWEGAVQVSLEAAVVRLLGTDEPKMLEWQLGVREWELAGMERKLAPGEPTQVAKAVEKLRRPHKRVGATTAGHSRATRKFGQEALKRVADDFEILVRTASMRPFVEILSEDPHLGSRARQALDRIEHLVERALRELEGISEVAQDEWLRMDWRALYTEKLEQHRRLQRELQFKAGLEESAGTSPWRFLRAVREGLEGWVEGSPPVPHSGQAPDGTSHLVVLWTGADLEQDVTMVSVAIPPDRSEVILRVRVRGELRFELYLPMGNRELSPAFAEEVLTLLAVRRSDVVEAVGGEALLAEHGMATEVARQEERIPAWPRAGRTSAVWSLREPPGQVGINLSSQWEWMDRALEIVEGFGDREQLKRAVSDHLGRYGFARETLDSMLETLEAVREWILLRIGAAGGSAAGARQANALRLFSEAFPKDSLTRRLLALAENPLLSEEIRQPGSLATAYLLAVVRATAEDETPTVLSLHQEAKKRYRVRLRQQWEEMGLVSGLRGGSLFWTEASRFPMLQVESSSNGQAQPPRFEFLASAVLRWEELVRELDQVEASEEAAIDLGFGPVSTSLEALRQRLWEDIGTWDRTFTLLYEARGSPHLNLRVEVMPTPRVRIIPVGHRIGRRLRIKEGLVAEAEAGTVGALRRLLAEALEDAQERAYFLGLPPDEVVDIERAGRDVEPITDSTRLEEGDDVFVALPDFAVSAEEIEKSAQALYRVPDLVLRLLGDENAEGKYSPLAWQYFLKAVERQDPEGYEPLKLLPVPERYVIHGDLVVYRSTGQGLLLTGGQGAGKSLLGALLVGQVQDGRLEINPDSPWEYVANDRVDLLMFGDHLLAGPMLSEGRVRLTTRLRLGNAQRLARRDAGRRFRFFVYQTQVPEQSRMVPVRGIVWLNRRASQRGRREPEAILGLTRNWTRIREVWTPLFLEKVRTLPVQEHFIGSRPGLGRFQRIAADVKRWAPYFRRRNEAGLEETILLQPGEPRYGALYRKLFMAPGLSPLANVAEGPFRQFLTGGYVSEGFPVDSRFLLRVVPETPEEASEWSGLGLEPVAYPEAVEDHFLDRAQWPPKFGTLPDSTEYLELSLPAGSFYSEEDGPQFSRLRIFPGKDRATFEAGGFSDGFLDQVRKIRSATLALETTGVDHRKLEREAQRKVPREEFARQARKSRQSALLWIGVPLGIQEEQGRQTFAGLTDLPAERLMSEEARRQAQRLAEEEARRARGAARAAAAAAAPTGPSAEQAAFRASVERLQAALRSELKKVEEEHEGYLSSGRIKEIEAAIGRLGSLELQEKLMKEEDKIRGWVEDLPGAVFAGAPLEAAVQKLLAAYPEIRTPVAEGDPAAWLARLLEEPVVRKRGWTPARLAEFMRHYRRSRALWEQRIPHFPHWYEGVLPTVDAGNKRLAYLLSSGSSRQGALILNLAGLSRPRFTLGRGVRWILTPWTDFFYLMDPELGQASLKLAEIYARQPSLAEQTERLSRPRPKGQRPAAEAQDEEYLLNQWDAVFTRRLRQGLSGNPWLQVAPVALDPPRLPKWSLPAKEEEKAVNDLAAFRIVLLLTGGGDGVIESYLEAIYPMISEEEQAFAARPPLDALAHKLVLRSETRGRERAWKQLQQRLSKRFTWDTRTRIWLIRHQVQLEGVLEREPANERAQKLLAWVRQLLDLIAADNRLLRHGVLTDTFRLGAPTTQEGAMFRFDWDTHLERFSQDLRTLFNGLQFREPAGGSTGLTTGLEEAEGILLQPGHAEYDGIFRSGLSAEETVKGPLIELLKRAQSEGKIVRIRMVPQSSAEADAWVALGLEPLAGEGWAMELISAHLAWPRGGLRIEEQRSQGEVIQEYVGVGLFAPQAAGDYPDPILLDRFRIVPKEGATFSYANVNLKLQEKRPFLDQLRTLWGSQGRVRLVGIPLGLVEEKEEFIRQVLRLTRTGVPLARVILTEEEVRSARQAQAQSGRREATAQATQALSEKADAVRSDLQRSLLAWTRDFGSYLDQTEVRRVSEGIEALQGRAIVERIVAQGIPVEKLAAAAGEHLEKESQSLADAIQALPGRRLSDAELDRAVGELLSRFPDLFRDGQNPVAQYHQLLSNKELYALGWTPLRFSQLLRAVEHWKEVVQKRMPEVRWFRSVRILADPETKSLVQVASADRDLEHAALIFRLSRHFTAEQAIREIPHHISHVWGNWLLTYSPGSMRAFKAGNDPRPVVVRELVEGLRENPWIEAPALPHTGTADLMLAVIVNGGARASPLSRWTLQDVVSAWVSVLMAGEPSRKDTLRVADRSLDSVEDRLKALEPLKNLMARAVRGRAKELRTFSQRGDLDAGALATLISVRALLNVMGGEPERHSRLDRLTERVLEDLKELSRSDSATPHPTDDLNWRNVYQEMVKAYTYLLRGVRLPKLQAEPPAEVQAGGSTGLTTGLEEAVVIQPGGSTQELYEHLFPAGMSALDNVASGPLRKFLQGGYEQKGFARGTRFLLRVVPQTPAEAGPWQELGFKPVQDLQAVRSAFFSNAEQPLFLRTLPDGTEYLEFTMPADSSYAERDLPELTAIRFFPAGGVALFSSLTLPEALQEQISILRTIAQLKLSPSPDLKELQRLVGQISSRYLTDQLVRLGDLEKVALVGVPLGFPDEGSLRQFVDLAGFPAERLISEEERERARKEAVSREQDATFLQNARRLAEELDLERARQALTGLLEKLTQAPLEGQYLDPEAIQSLRERIGRLGPTERDWQDLKTQPADKVRRRVLEDLARDRAEIQRGIRELPGLPLPKSALEQVAPRLLQEYPELSRRGDKDPVKFYTHFFQDAQVAKAGWTPLRVAQFLEELRRTREAVLAQVPGAPWFETVFLAPERAHVPYDVSFDPVDPGKRHGWVFVLDPTLDSSRIPEWAPYLTLRLFAALLLTEDPVAEQVTREMDPDLETRDPADRVLTRFVGQVRRIVEKGLTDHPWLESSRFDLRRVAAKDAEYFRSLWEGGKDQSGHQWALNHLVEARIAHQLGGERVVPAMLQSMDFTLQAVESRLGDAQSVPTLARLYLRELWKRASKTLRKVSKEEAERFAKRVFEEKRSKGETVVLDLVKQRRGQNLGDLAALAAIQTQTGLLQEPGKERLARIESLKERLITELDTTEETEEKDPTKLIRTGHWDSIYERVLSGYATLVRGLKVRGTAGPLTKLTTGLEEAVASLAVEAPAASEQQAPLRFLADTIRGDARVLHLLQLAVLLNLRHGLPIQAAGVATEGEAASALAQLPVDARELFRQLVVTYRAGDEADYQFARAVAEGMIPRFHPGLAITTVEDPAVIHWFFEALQRLGVGELSSDEQQRVLELLEAA